MFARPWEKNSEDEAVRDALGEAAHKPWDPPVPKTEKRIRDQHKQKQIIQGNPRPERIFQAQAFAKEYIIDFDHRAAAIRMGVHDDEGEAVKMGRAMLNDPETLQCIQAFMAQMPESTIVTRERVMWGLLQEALLHGLGASHSARVAAWSKLAKLLGMEEAKEDPSKAKSASGVMLVPYMPGGIEAWETAAVGQQAQLKADVRN